LVNWRDVFKDPITAPSKRSKKGVQAVIKTDAGYFAQRKTEFNESLNLLQPVYRTGELLIDEDFEIIRQRASV